MNERIEQCLYLSGLTAHGCWDEMDEYAKQGIHKFAELIVWECIDYCGENLSKTVGGALKIHMGIE